MHRVPIKRVPLNHGTMVQRADIPLPKSAVLGKYPIVDIFRLAGVSGTQKVSKLVKTVQSGLGE